MAIFPTLFAAMLAMASLPIAVDRLEENNYDGCAVEVRGFAYPTPEGWILSTDPGLKSCCRGSPAKKREQLFFTVPGQQLPEGQAVVMAGTLRKDTAKERGYYTLEDARLIEGKRGIPWATALLGATTIALCLAAGRYLRRTR